MSSILEFKTLLSSVALCSCYREVSSTPLLIDFQNSQSDVCTMHIQGDTLFLFFETKTTTTMQGDIGVARSFDQGATWGFLGIALDEAWHLSYPFVFKYENEVVL